MNFLGNLTDGTIILPLFFSHITIVCSLNIAKLFFILFTFNEVALMWCLLAQMYLLGRVKCLSYAASTDIYLWTLIIVFVLNLRLCAPGWQFHFLLLSMHASQHTDLGLNRRRESFKHSSKVGCNILLLAPTLLSKIREGNTEISLSVIP